MIFNGIEKDYLTVTRGRKRPAWAPVQRELIPVPNMPGSYLSQSNVQIRRIDVPVFLMADSFSDLQKVKEDIAEWLVHDEPKKLMFKDEPDRTYYAVVDGGLDLEELVHWGDGVISFICPDPYKYGPEQTLTFPADIVTVENKGTAEADPIFELTAKKKTTFAMIANADEEYNLIGKPTSVTEEVVDSRSLIFEEDGSTVDEWTSAGTSIDGGNITGSFGTDNSGITVPNYGTGSRWHGPAAIKEINPVQDFEVKANLQIRTSKVIQTARVEIYLFDENMDLLGKMGIVDDSSAKYTKKGEARYGPFEGRGVNYPISASNYQYNWDYYFGMLRFRRVGNEFEFYITRIATDTNHVYSLKETYIDANNDYSGKLKYIQIHIGTYGTRAYSAKLFTVSAYELTQATEDQTPYILEAGDLVEFNHKDEDILVNGEPRNDLKDFGGSFFKLAKGENMLIVTPEDSFDTKVTYADKFL